MILLDTNALWWVFTGSPKLGKRCIEKLKSDEVYFSSLSAIELAVKRMLAGQPALELSILAKESNIGELAFETKHAGEIHAFTSLLRHDPFDRALLAQAATEGARFCTPDRKILDLELAWVIDSQE